ncbi:hypothetical protein M0804_014771 [Polistes exclamans]|nr:hypothetical protein M0804_014771 [Polistes exclamans]
MPEDEFVENYLEKKHPKLLEIFFPFALGIIMLFIRDACRTFIFKPVGKYFGIEEEEIRIPQNDILENVYAERKILDNKMIVILSKELKCPKREIKEWFKLRLAKDKHLDLEYFSYCR